MRVHPRRFNTVYAVSFMVGSSCFVLGSVPAYARAVGGVADAVTYFIGSIFFTLASYGQLVQAQSPQLAADAETSDDERASARLVGWRPHDLNWLAAATQFPGTLFFNVTTFAAITQGLSAAETDQQVWRPDFYGSILFLVASAFALAGMGRGWRLWSERDSPWWWTNWLNMMGSIFFMLSAIGAYVIKSSGELVNLHWATGGTFLGALCFFLGAWLMIPSFTRAAVAARDTPA